MSLAIPIPDRPFKESGQRDGDLYLLAEVPYQTAWQWQQQLVSQRKKENLASGDAINQSAELRDVLILLQHPPVYTLGQGADARFLKFDPQQAGDEIHRIERGGEVTYHCPGQLVGYPILNLRWHRQDLHWYLRGLEEVIIQTLASYGLRGDRIPGLTGVWLEGKKVAAIGIKVSRWITMHGFALNVCPDLSGFEKIVPCGIEGKSAGAIAQFLPAISLIEVQERLVKHFEQVFGLS
ncbi:MAG: lipoyl(octanoyl) transferase LipB, partial [Phormidesmis sp.]